MPLTTPRDRTPQKRPTESFHRLTATLLALAACILMPACKPATAPDPLNRSALLAERDANRLEASIDEAQLRFGTASPSDRARLVDNLKAIVLKFDPGFAGGAVKPLMNRGGFSHMASSSIPQGAVTGRALRALADIESYYDSADARRAILAIRDRAEERAKAEPYRYAEIIEDLEAIIRDGDMEEENR